MEAIQHGKMPMAGYLWLNARANLSEEEKRALMDGLRATFQREPAGAFALERR